MTREQLTQYKHAQSTKAEISAQQIPDGYCKQRLIVCAAMRSEKTGLIVIGVRHYDRLMLQQIAMAGGREALGRMHQGFIDQKGVFLDRLEAWTVAEAADQIRFRDFDNGTLYSENLY